MKRGHGEGGIYEQGENTFRIRYRVNGRRFNKTVTGTLSEARTELRRLLRSGDTGEHVAPNVDTLAAWATHWLAIGAPGRRRQKVGARSLERYSQILHTHVLPALGERKLQKIEAGDIDRLYIELEGKIAPRTARQTHSVLNACLNAAVRTGKLAISPMAKTERTPPNTESDHGIALDDDQLRTLVQGFRGSELYGIVSVAAFTGARRNEILALRWSDLDAQRKELRIERAVEETKAHGVRFKGPKKESHKRTITIDDDLLALLLAEREKHLRIVAGVPYATLVDLSLIRLPEGALMFPKPFSFTEPQDPRHVTYLFVRHARALGFKMRLHDLRGTHETLLLDRGVPVHVVAARCGHDPATLLRSYAKRTQKADTSAANIIGNISRGILGR
jgi:integrase